MKLFNVFCVVLVASCPSVLGVAGSLSHQMTEITEQCCNKGTSYARNHTSRDCKSSVPSKVPAAFGDLCVLVMNECCYQYFDKKRDCDEGVDIALRRNDCSSATSEAAKSCCSECLRGSTTGSEGGSCSPGGGGDTAEELLPIDAFTQCCQKSSKGNSGTSLSRKPITLSTGGFNDDLTSVCEEYAPNELCAHHCIPVPGSYKCECNPGFKLMADKKNCIEVVKNRCKPRNPCQHKCNDNGVEVKCSCRRGYQLQADGKTCKDIDECLLDTPVCSPDMQCRNTQGSYKCIPKKRESVVQSKGQCPPGFARNINSNVCDDIDECSLPHPPCPSYLCENVIGGYKCGGVSGDPENLDTKPNIPLEDRCPTGFRSGSNEDCEDVDECAIHKDDCNPSSQFCINTKGSFYCQDRGSRHCPPGFKIDPDTGRCEDIDECQDSHSLCPSDKYCVNVPGAYDCKPKIDTSRSQHCPEGFRMKYGKCEDIDECVEGTHLCDHHQNCLNTNGSHECHCKLGYQLDATLGACVDVNECATDQNDCIPESQRCDNTVGSYICVRFVSCGTGYILHHSTSKCEDIDECALGTHNCARAGPQFQCVNIPGSFRCVRKQASTTSTTVAPEWDYYYYDSEEEPANNNTNPAPQTTTNKTEVSTPETTTTTTTEKIPETTPTQTSTASTKPTEEIPKEPEVSIESRLKEVEPKNEDKYTTDDNDNKVDLDDTKQQNNKEDAKPEEPHVVFVEVPKETATVSGVKNDDGSVVLDTEDVPKNTWTKINEKPQPVVCPAGFEKDSFGACVDIDECETHRHVCSGLTEVCHNNMGGYICECAPGFRRDLVTRSCDLIVTTTSTTTSTTTPAPSTSTSPEKSNWWWGGFPVYRPTSRPFRPRNLCDVGYHMNSATGKCEDINECTNGLANCAAVEICVNTDGGYRCECPPNWVLDQVRHRCVPNRDKNKFPPGYGNVPSAVNSTGTGSGQEVIIGSQYGAPGKPYVEPSLTNLGDRGTVLKCPWGYRLGDDNTCEDIDECSDDLSICGSMQICSNLPGGYTCSCPPGHKMIGDHLCEDVDECALAGDKPICSQNANCINTIGSYQCKCHEGFRSAPANDKVCVDVDECTGSRAGYLCQQRCNNVWGSYKCSCHRGYRLNPDNRTCSDIDECTEFKHKNLCVGKCLNEPGSYKCGCPKGYRLSEDNRSCIDIDECETGIAPCANSNPGVGANDICLNTRGSYRCERITCLPGYRLENKHRCTKTEQMCAVTDWECLHQPSTYSYNYITFVSNLYIPNTVDLFTMRGPLWPNAQMKFELSLINVNAPPTVKKASIKSFLLAPTNQHAVVSIVESLQGPQSIELELSMKLYLEEKFAGRAVAKLFIFVSEYEF